MSESDVEVEKQLKRKETNWLGEDDRHGDSVQGGFELGEGIAGTGGRRGKVSIIGLEFLSSTWVSQLLELFDSPRCISFLGDHTVE